MPNDAKLGLVLGVGLVIAIGVVFYRKDASVAPSPAAEAIRAVVTPGGPADAAVRGQNRPTRAKPTGGTSADAVSERTEPNKNEADEKP